MSNPQPYGDGSDGDDGSAGQARVFGNSKKGVSTVCPAPGIRYRPGLDPGVAQEGSWCVHTRSLEIKQGI